MPGVYVVSIKPIIDTKKLVTKENNYYYPKENAHILDTFYIHANDNHTWKNLTAIYNFGCLNWRSFEHSFMNASRLCKLPESKMFSDKNKLDIYNIVTNISGCFKNCTNINYIEYGFEIPYTTINFSELFMNCFQNEYCISGEATFKDIFGETGLTNTIRKINSSSAFYNCKYMTGQLPIKKLWYSNSNIGWISQNAFHDCLNIDNMQFIPTDWGGISR